MVPFRLLRDLYGVWIEYMAQVAKAIPTPGQEADSMTVRMSSTKPDLKTQVDQKRNAGKLTSSYGLCYGNAPVVWNI